MIIGEVTAELEATVVLEARGANGNARQLTAVIDTGFTGFFTLPAILVSGLDLPWVGREHALIGDGSVHSFDVYSAIVIWDGRPREVEVNQTETVPLIGMALLVGHRLQIDAVVGGGVRIEPLS